MITKNEDATFSATIDGDDYSFSLWTASKSIETLAELSAVGGEFASALSKVFVDAGGLTGKVDPNLIGACVTSLTRGLAANPKGTLSLIKRLTSDSVLCGNKPIIFDAHYRGRTMHLLKVIRAGLEVQYADFFTVFADVKKGGSEQTGQLAASSS